MSEFVLALQNVTKTFSSGSEELTVLHDLSLKIEPMAVTSITGESGSGKSTLLNLIGGLDKPSSGRITVGPYTVSHLDELALTGYRRDMLGFIFQFHYLLKEFSALENIMLPALIAGHPRRTAQARAERLIREVGLEDRKLHFPVALSGGERQRVAVARALVNDPLLILADEPTGNLDEGNSRIVEDILFNLVRKNGKTLILVTHDRRLAAQGDRCLTLHKGRLAEV
jgi:lipoprotein-releasing system ATP-binding protein